MLYLENIREDLKEFFSQEENVYKLKGVGCYEVEHGVFFRELDLTYVRPEYRSLEKFFNILDCDIVKRVQKDGYYREFVEAFREISLQSLKFLTSDYEYPLSNYRVSNLSNRGFHLSAVEIEDNGVEVEGVRRVSSSKNASVLIEQQCTFIIEYPHKNSN